jgi:hypothetical protein
MKRVARSIVAEARMRRLLIAALVFFVQMTAAAAFRPGDLAAVRHGLLAALADPPICHAGVAPDTGQKPTPLHGRDHGHACALCPACQVVEAAALIAPDDGALPLPSVTYLRRTMLSPPTTGPPHKLRYAPKPRGPPHFVV